MSSRTVSEDIGKLILRVTVGGLMLFHGIDKITGGIGGIKGMLDSKGIPELVAYGVYAGEVLAPALLIIGLYTVPAAVLFAINMVIAVALAHPTDVMKLGDHGEWGIELQAFYILGALAIAFLGPGKYSASQGEGWYE